VFTTSGAPVGALADFSNQPIMNDGLWTLTFGNTGGASLFLTVGLNGEEDRLFARIDPAPEPAMVGVVMVALGLMVRRKGISRARTE
jgi:hypothetical protein